MRNTDNDMLVNQKLVFNKIPTDKSQLVLQFPSGDQIELRRSQQQLYLQNVNPHKISINRITHLERKCTGLTWHQSFAHVSTAELQEIIEIHDIPISGDTLPVQTANFIYINRCKNLFEQTPSQINHYC